MESMQSSPSEDLSEREKEILDFEKQWIHEDGRKDQAIRETFHISPTRYYQLLLRVLEHPQALRYDPLLVKRLLRIRQERQEHRRVRTLVSSAE